MLRLIPLLSCLIWVTYGNSVSEFAGAKGSARLVQGTPTPTPTPVRPAIPAPKRAPNAFFGPPELSHLASICFLFQESTYRFEFCPFNITTQMTSTSGYVIGIFDRWKSISQQIYTDGSPCGDKKNRMMTVNLECLQTPGTDASSGASIVNSFTVKEPSTCEYEMTAKISEFCNVNMTNWIQLLHQYNSSSILVEAVSAPPAVLASVVPETPRSTPPNALKSLSVIEMEQRILALEAELLQCKANQAGGNESPSPSPAASAARDRDLRQRKYASTV
jgi:uncharacterized small protein (DUF1192 family)